MNKKNFAWGVLLIVALLFSYFLIWKNEETNQKPSKKVIKTSLRLAWVPGATFTGDYVAKAKGFWNEMGIEVEITPGGFEHDAIKLVAAGTNTFGITSGPQILKAKQNGIPVVAIGAVIPRSPIGWITKKESNIKKPHDFKSKKIGAQYGTHTEITLSALCSKLKIPMNSFTRVPVKFDPRPFLAGTVDVLPVYIIDQPIDLSKHLNLNIIDPGDYGVSLAYGNVYFTSEKTLKERPEEVKKFLKGAQKGWLWTNNNRSEAVNILSGYVENTDKKILLAKLNATFDFIKKTHPKYLGVFPMTYSEWQSTYQILVEYSNLKSNLSLDKCFTNNFLE